MLGSVTRGDEKFVAAGTTFEFLFPRRGGTQGINSVSPFAPKSVTGERSYNDYDILSAIQMADLSGGMGQERLTDATKYFDAQGVDARGGRLILAPFVQEATLHGLSTYADDTLQQWSADVYMGSSFLAWHNVDTTYPQTAASFTTESDQTLIDRVWLPLKGNVGASTITVEIWTDNGGTPSNPAAIVSWDGGAKTATATLDKADLRPAGGWLEAVFANQVPLTASTKYWAVIKHSGTTGSCHWYGDYNTTAGNSNNRSYYGGAWHQDQYWNLFAWLDDPTVRPDGPLHFLVGAGQDGVRRVWGYAGKYLYYINAAGTPVVATNAAAAYRCSADITDAVFFQGSGETYPFIVLALGDSADMVKCDGDALGTMSCATISSKQARKLCVHDDILWRVDSINILDGTLIGDWSESGTTCPIGSKTYPARVLISWNGDVYAGKDDGLYKASFTAGYPASGSTLYTTRQIDLNSIATPRNFYATAVHQNDLYFSIRQGLLRYTSGSVLTSVTPTTGLKLAASQRSEYMGLYSTLNSLWAATEGAAGALSSILSYTEGKWHPLSTSLREMDMNRTLVVDAGLYGATERLWFNRGLQLCYMQIPTSSQMRWLWDEQDYLTTGWLKTSWIDGNLRTVEKDWLAVEVDCEDVGATADGQYITIEYRTLEDATWTFIDAVVVEGVSRLALPTGSHSTKIQLRVKLLRNTATEHLEDTPKCLAVVLKYMERPTDVQMFTVTYEWSSRQLWRNGEPVQMTPGAWLTQLATLRNLAEPFTYYHVAGNSYTCHIIDYNVAVGREEMGDLKDELTLTAVVRLQVIA